MQEQLTQPGIHVVADIPGFSNPNYDPDAAEPSWNEGVVNSYKR